MNSFTLAVLVRNQFGVLNRVTSMFRRRRFNITSLSVSVTESDVKSRITITADGGGREKDQLIDQLYKLPVVVSIAEIKAEDCVLAELLLLKVQNKPELRSDIHAAAEAFGAKIVDYTRDSVVLQMVGNARNIDAFIEVMQDYTVLEICRTGVISLERGAMTIEKKAEIY
ncbi:MULTISPECIES: acetolactate synthase small subunit [unclassified Acutalibacter]|jgi:acetolactate synthase-1/3 small subunit|uniref:acetolactate synthase small subunit n=1 Tax=unclassified Acutalibacter TaxID=2620728 RepID=UPI001411CF44|nr:MULTISPECIES: acetolactate synthase small subunit [unclassified Acutalibacter]MCI9225511.1 acetolactate synthase small subunit [Acutalibacter sp.]NBJ89797.1 acetolactate synthase small subunit [Acutalibacter sp. 1XD8-36]